MDTHVRPYRCLAQLGLLTALVVPSATMAAAPTTDDVAPTPAFTAPDCGQTVVDIEIDVATGDLYFIDPDTGSSTPTDDDIDIWFGELGHVIIVLHYTDSDWDVTVSPDDDPPTTYGTTNGTLQYTISTNVEEYLFESAETTGASTMTTMAPVVPDIILRPKKECPPST